jgi:hypothetical protein
MNTADQRMLTRVPKPVAQLPLAHAKALKLAPAKPEMNRQERVIFTSYHVMIGLVVVFLGGVAWLGA